MLRQSSNEYEALENGQSPTPWLQKMGCCTANCKTYCFYATSFILLLIGVLILTLWGFLFNAILVKELALSNGSRGYEMWKETPLPMYFNLHLYNWTNAQEVIDSKWNITPHFEECGPYVYIEKHIRVNMQWHDNDTITYNNKRVWYYQPELSKGTLEDPITNLNVIAATMSYIVRDKGLIPQRLINFLLNEKEKSIILTKTANEWLFQGFDDELLEMASKINISGIDIPFDKFGWFYGRNESETFDGLFNIYTGNNDINKLGILDLWNRSNQSKFYDGYCGNVNGTSGELWPPIGSVDTVEIFSSDICSSMEMTYLEGDFSIEGIPGRQYIATADVFDNGTRVPHTGCFNPPKVLPSGVRNVSLCRFGAPAFISYPHFYLADPDYRKNVSGMKPNAAEHKFTLALEPITGVPLDVKAQLQINIYIEPIQNIKLFKHVKHTMIPMLWFKQTATLTEEFSSEIKVLLNLPNIGMYTGYALIGLGGFFTMICLIITLKYKFNKNETPLLDTPQASQG